jgi:hypothetical protein
MMKNISLLVCAILIGTMGCKVPYTPKIGAINSNILVVEGTINTGGDSTIIKLSRTVNLATASSMNPEINAVVTVESNQGVVYTLNNQGNGNYSSGVLNLDNTQQYHLKIKTQDGAEYLSAFEAVKNTPPIDSIGFTIQPNGLQVYANTHDPNNATLYYRWEYAETWQFHAKYESNYVSNGDSIIGRPPARQIFTCFSNSYSSTIVLGSSAALKQDVIYQQPLTQIVSTSEKLENRYSILVKQYALTKDEFDFWTNLKKNTEQLGSIFDPQPSNINGNIQCTSNPKTPVIGWVAVTNVQQKRVFIDNSDVPRAWVVAYPYDCALDTNLYCRLQAGGGNQCLNEVEQNLIPLNSAILPISPIILPGSPAIVGYSGSSLECADCTIRGTTIQPAFWR